jgi:hypothetical protein
MFHDVVIMEEKTANRQAVPAGESAESNQQSAMQNYARGFNKMLLTGISNKDFDA